MLSGLRSTDSFIGEEAAVSVVRSVLDVKQRIASNFSRAAGSYDRAATLQKRVAGGVVQRLPDLCGASAILDMGTGTGSQSQTLSSLYPDAQVVGMDMAMGMLEYARQQNSEQAGMQWCSGDIEALPFAGESFDLVYSSLAIQWCSLDRVLSEVARVLKPGGHFVFSTLAQSSLHELDQAWQSVNEPDRVNRFDAFEDQARTVDQGCLQSKFI